MEAVLFDFFDTLATIRKGEAFYEPALESLHESLAENGVDVPFEKFTQAYFGVRDKLYAQVERTLAEPHFNVRISLTLKDLGHRHDASSPIVRDATAAFADVFKRYIDLDDEALPLLTKLRGKYSLGVVSNFALPECLRSLVHDFGLDSFFDVIVVSADIDKRKPDPAIFVKALQALNVEASSAAFVGDTPKTDVKGARNVGMTSILVKRKRSLNDGEALLYTQGEDDTNTKPDFTVGRLISVADVLMNR